MKQVRYWNEELETMPRAGEPGANVKSTKQAIETIWGARCYDDIDSSEISNFGFECIFQKGTHVSENMFYAECLDPDTLEPVEEGRVGELVLSNLCTETMPLIRYRIKDLVKFNREPCECGRTFLRLDGGILGRSDDMFQFAGVNVFPSAIENVIRNVDCFSNEYQIIVPTMGKGGCYEEESPVYLSGFSYICWNASCCHGRTRCHSHRGHGFPDRPFLIGNRAVQAAYECLGRPGE